MYVRLTILVSMLAFCSHGAELSPEKWNHDKRIARDCAGFDLVHILKEKEEQSAWLAVRMRPEIIREYFDLTTHAHPYIKGTCDLIQKLSTNAPCMDLAFKWEIPRWKSVSWRESLYFKEVGERTTKYRVFYTGGTAIVKLKPKLSGRERFAEVVSIPDAWAKHVKPALEYVKKRLDVKKPFPPEDKKELRALFDHPNPFLSIAAWRAYVREAPLKEADFKKYVLESKRPMQAIRAYLLLTSPRWKTHAEAMRKHILVSQDIESYYGLIVAITLANKKLGRDPLRGKLWTAIYKKGFFENLLRARDRQLKPYKPSWTPKKK